MVLKVTFDIDTNMDIMQVNTQNRVSLATAQLLDAVKREGVGVNRSSPDLLMVLGLILEPGSIRSPFQGQHKGRYDKTQQDGFAFSFRL